MQIQWPSWTIRTISTLSTTRTSFQRFASLPLTRLITRNSQRRTFWPQTEDQFTVRPFQRIPNSKDYSYSKILTTRPSGQSRWSPRTSHPRLSLEKPPVSRTESSCLRWSIRVSGSSRSQLLCKWLSHTRRRLWTDRNLTRWQLMTCMIERIRFRSQYSTTTTRYSIRSSIRWLGNHRNTRTLWWEMRSLNIMLHLRAGKGGWPHTRAVDG